VQALYISQQLFNATDRGIEQQIKFNAAYQMFCGKTIVKNWHCPDHTKIQEFRSRLEAIANNELSYLKSIVQPL